MLTECENWRRELQIQNITGCLDTGHNKDIRSRPPHGHDGDVGVGPDRGVRVLPTSVLLWISPHNRVQDLPLFTHNLHGVLVVVHLQAVPPSGLTVCVAAAFISSTLPDESLDPDIRK